MSKKNVCVVVLGDIGRSPRMQYHSISLAEQGHKVDIVAYRGTPPLENLTKQNLVSFHYLVPSLEFPNKLFTYFFKTLWQAFHLFIVLCVIRCPDYLLVQNPPAIPTLFICYFYKIIFRPKLIIDWHNYGHSIMALNLGKDHVLVRVSRYIEKVFGRKADYNFCVTNEMKKDLNREWGISAITLYDRPPEIFRSINLSEKHDVINCLGLKYKELLSENGIDTAFTRIVNDEVELKPDRPALLISSTSWTEDEDFSILLSALTEYESSCVNGNSHNLPKLICVITGKGPLKEFYEKKIKSNVWSYVSIITPWLESKDYPKLLASADLGVCLHTSSSGLDLPMKVVDMFGCGLPVCAYNFKSLYELVKHDRNSYVFNDEKELSNQLINWFDNFPNNKNQQVNLSKFKRELAMFQQLRWKENWESTFAPIIR